MHKRGFAHFTNPVCIGILTFLSIFPTFAAPKKNIEFKKEKRIILRKINNIKAILTNVATKKKASIGQLHALNRQIESNQLLIKLINREIGTLNHKLQEKKHTILSLEADLVQLKKEYAAMIYMGAKTMTFLNKLVFYFSVASFYQFFQRLQYIKQYPAVRRRYFNEIKKCGAIVTKTKKK